MKAPDEQHHLSIIIVNWNTRELLARCLASIDEHPPRGLFEVIVVDNASQDGSPQMVRERFPQVRLIENEKNVGFARANNQAMLASNSKFVLLLNSDTLILDESLQRLIECMEAHPRAGVCGPMLLNSDGSFQASYADFPTLRTELLHQAGLSKRLISRYYPSYGPDSSRRRQSVDWMGGACLMVRRECMKEVGLLDEAYVMYSEEMDWCFRMKQHGWNILYCPDARIVHFGGGSVDQFSTWKYVRIQKSKIRFFGKHHGEVFARLLAIYIRALCAAKTGVCFLFMVIRIPGHRTTPSQRCLAYWAAAKSSLW